MLLDNKEEFLKYSPTGRIVALDIGTKRIGIAITDENRIISTPMEVLNTKNIDFDINYLINLFKENKIKGLVIGLPLSFDGKETKMSNYIKNFTEKILLKIDIPIIFQDERLSSFEAEEFLIEKIGTKKTKNVVDSVSASYILEYFLNS